MQKFILLTEKKWNIKLYEYLKENTDYKWTLINNKNKFTIDKINKLKPDIIFIPHWSYFIKKDIFEKYPCIVFHMTDLPFGRGGSPLQNLIARGFKSTKLSALKVTDSIDTGDIYLKKNLNLKGSAQEIFERTNNIISEMIINIIRNSIKPKPQKGKPTYFQRRKPEQSNISQLKNGEEVYNYIRMLDAEGYPKAFLETKYFKYEFTKALLKSDKTITANVRISKKQ
ncbi:MAG: formyltransferase family protein [Ignavibacteriae bacterium]|nr:formyltransferase family protein [Ignavibacteriota bacterium]